MAHSLYHNSLQRRGAGCWTPWNVGTSDSAKPPGSTWTRMKLRWVTATFATYSRSQPASLCDGCAPHAYPILLPVGS